ncbi:hypothetical protein ABZ299_08170 [Streptomyces sp. NPDC006184]|uniref:hypothetical protein n=1 Tax=Streptomyces sp. NPDC006184 TaxID=3155455 RepID=UPI00339FC773
MIAIIMSGMQSVQVGAKAGKTRGSLGSASVCLFALGSVNAGIYLAELITDGARYVEMLESAFGLLFAGWIAGAVHLRRTSKAERQNG